jgi:molybdopterin converting factor small subunit
MATVYIPAPLRTLTAGEAKVSVGGETLREIFDRLEEAYPGLKARLLEGDKLRAGMAVFVDGTISTNGLRARVGPESEVHFAPAIAGGCAARTTRTETASRFIGGSTGLSSCDTSDNLV